MARGYPSCFFCGRNLIAVVAWYGPAHQKPAFIVAVGYTRDFQIDPFEINHHTPLVLFAIPHGHSLVFGGKFEAGLGIRSLVGNFQRLLPVASLCAEGILLNFNHHSAGSRRGGLVTCANEVAHFPVFMAARSEFSYAMLWSQTWPSNKSESEF